MAKKLYDLAAKTGEYTDKAGQKKGRWQNVGAVMQSDDGSKFIMLSKWFNPAGVPDLNGKNAASESILLSMFAPNESGATQAPAAQYQQPPRQQAPQRSAPVDDDDSIPF